MTRIVSAVFDDQPAADLATRALHRLGVSNDLVECFKLNAPGQHGVPAGDHVEADAAARGGEGGAVAGAAVGSAGGLAVGAYAGSLAGALRAMGEADDSKPPPERPAGVMIAVNVDATVGEDLVVETLYENGAKFIELSKGTWRDGAWADFDPVAPPRSIAFDARTH